MNTIIICTEKGELEKQALLFVRSLRRFGGHLNDTPIISYSPRKESLPQKSTMALLEKENVHVITDTINTKFSDYGFGNKPQVCAHAEENFPAQQYVFFDSDQIILQEPKALLLENCDTKILAVDKKGVGSNGSDDLMGFWDSLHHKFEVLAPKKIKTCVTNEEIWAYWNVGLVPVKGDKRIYQTWNEVFLKMMTDQDFPNGIRTFTDQVSFSIAVQKMGLKIENLPLGYNYPIHAQNEILSPAKLTSHSEAYTLHYHKSFKSPVKKENPLLEFLKSHPDVPWFLEQFKELELYPRPILYKLDYFYKRYSHSIKTRLKWV